MVTPKGQPTNRQDEYSAICLFEGWKIGGRDLQYFYLRRKEGEEKLKVPKNKDSANNYQSDISVKMYSVTKVQSLVSAKKC